MKLYIGLIRNKFNKSIIGYIGPFNSTNNNLAQEQLFNTDITKVTKNNFIELVNLDNNKKVAEFFI